MAGAAEGPGWPDATGTGATFKRRHARLDRLHALVEGPDPVGAARTRYHSAACATASTTIAAAASQAIPWLDARGGKSDGVTGGASGRRRRRIGLRRLGWRRLGRGGSRRCGPQPATHLPPRWPGASAPGGEAFGRRRISCRAPRAPAHPAAPAQRPAGPQPAPRAPMEADGGVASGSVIAAMPAWRPGSVSRRRARAAMAGPL